jgi:hypothetical protein
LSFLRQVKDAFQDFEPQMNLARPVAATKRAMDEVGAGRCPAAPIDNRCAGYQPAPQCEEFEAYEMQINADEVFVF